MPASPTFSLNGSAVSLEGDAAEQSLLRWLRGRHLTGTKEGCADGDCGACTVVLVERAHPDGPRYSAVNSCLLPVGLLPGREVLTVEALADGERLHPVQRALVDCAGSQCGYCTPGFVMSLFAGYYSGALDDATTEGNLCRCTGYRPIRTATEMLATATPGEDRFRALLEAPSAPLPTHAMAGFSVPTSIDEALALKVADPDAMWIAGATDLGVALSHHRPPAPRFIALDRIDALQALEIDDDSVRIGAAVPLSLLETRLHGIFPALDTLLHAFAARQVKHRATLGGNLGTASPIGDLLPLLLALDATIELAGPHGTRTLPIEDFFVDYRRTRRAADELICAVRLPRRGDITTAAYKVAKRQTDDISIVAAVFALREDAEGCISHARLAYGGVAAVPLRARRAEARLHGQRLDAATVEAVCEVLREEFTPLSDHRASAEYRRALAANLFRRHVEERAACA
jgi:xanthine dehydrogenase small subunit